MKLDGLDDETEFDLSYDCFELMMPLKLDELKFADILTLRNGERYVVADIYMCGEYEDYERDADIIENHYNKDLTYNRDDKSKDIIKVERTGIEIYQRIENEAKEMTLAEISKILGYDVKIIKEDKKND